MAVTPKLSDIELINYKFSPGDRLLARVSANLTKDQYRKIERAIIKMLGEHVRVLIINIRNIKLVRKRGEEVESLTGTCEDSERLATGKMSLNCSVVDFEPHDCLVALIPPSVTQTQEKQITAWLQHWTGKEVEVRTEKGMFYREQRNRRDPYTLRF